MTDSRRAKIFWSGGSQAVRLPKELRLPGDEVEIRRRGSTLVIETLPDDDDWDGFWDRLRPPKHPVRRGRTRSAEKRRPI